MSSPVDRPGTFRGEIKEYGLKEMESGAVAVGIRASLTQFFDQESKEWMDWSAYDQEAEGDIWIVKKDGKPNTNGVESLTKYAGWDGDIMAVIQGSWQTIPCQLVIIEESYKGQTRSKISFVNDYDRTPGGQLSNVDENKAKELAARFGSQFRAIAGNGKRSTPASTKMPNGRPPIPRARETPEPPMEPLPARTSGDDIPF